MPSDETYQQLLEKAEELGADCSSHWAFYDRHGFILPRHVADVRAFIKGEEDELTSEDEERDN